MKYIGALIFLALISAPFLAAAADYGWLVALGVFGTTLALLVICGLALKVIYDNR